MAISVTHQFVSAKGDGTDATLLRPSNWNADHNIEMATNRVIGRLTAGPGDAEELPVTSYMMGLLNTADYAALAILLGLPTTGDAKLTFKSTADSGWVLANDGSIGDATSGSTTRAHADTSALFTFFYNGFSDAVAPLQTSTGVGTTRVAQGTAAIAFSAHCRLVLPKQLGRALLIAGTGAGLTARTLGVIGGEETHALTAAESVDHVHTATGWTGSGTGTGSGTASVSGTASGTTVSGGDHTHTWSFSGTSGAMNSNASHSHTMQLGSYAQAGTDNGATVGNSVNGAGYYGVAQRDTNATNTDHTHPISGSGTTSSNGAHTHTYSGTVNSSGTCAVTSLSVSVTGVGGTTSGAAGFTGAAHNNMMPWTAWNIMVRL